MEFILKELPENITGYNQLKIKLIAETCLLISKSALIREESRGGHIRGDFQKENPDFRVHIIQKKDCEPTFIEIRK